MAFTVPTCVTPKVMLTKWGKKKQKMAAWFLKAKKKKWLETLQILLMDATR